MAKITLNAVENLNEHDLHLVHEKFTHVSRGFSFVHFRSVGKVNAFILFSISE